MVTSVVLNGCTNNHGTDMINPVQCAADTITTISFVKNIQPIFKAYCSITGCHTGTNPSGNLNLDSSVAYTQLLKTGTGYINTVAPTSSLLYSEMTTNTTIMPPTGKLDDCRIKLILKWIQQGANNN